MLTIQSSSYFHATTVLKTILYHAQGCVDFQASQDSARADLTRRFPHCLDRKSERSPPFTCNLSLTNRTVEPAPSCMGTLLIANTIVLGCYIHFLIGWIRLQIAFLECLRIQLRVATGEAAGEADAASRKALSELSSFTEGRKPGPYNALGMKIKGAM